MEKITKQQANYIVNIFGKSDYRDHEEIGDWVRAIIKKCTIRDPQEDLISNFDTDCNVVILRHYDEVEEGDTLLVFKDLQEGLTADYFFTPKELTDLRDNINKRLEWLAQNE